MTKRQPWYKEGRRPQRIKTCTECGRTFRDRRTTDTALIEAIFGECLCPECKRKKDSVTCVACGASILNPIYFNSEPYCLSCLPPGDWD